ncbi:MAG: sigma-70 family RNA polymerase sigma factor [Bacteroidales bacterium]|nr:sigma-70 family RNA polymerase sigma factor [Bacteroidales bacterium]MBN2756592.1 sigma-70 family RNA polymerase sigma factor [Bacteroidales bacterium]
MKPETDFSEKAKRDLELVEKAKQGDQKAYAKLLGYYRDTLFFMMKKMVTNVDDAEDLTIEALGKAFKMLDNYTPKYAFSTWLFKIATNHCIDFLRKQNRHNMLSIDDNFDEEKANSRELIHSESLDPEEKMIEGQKGILLNDIINKLNPDYQEIIKLKYYEGLSYIEISETLNIPIGTVKARLFRSKELLLSTLNSKDICL